MALEIPLPHLTFNDRSGLAVELIRENLIRNGLTAEVRSGDLSGQLRTTRYDFVDIDPFGPPTPFLETAFDAAPIHSGIGITATDTAVLCGTYPAACGQRYGARPMRSPQGAEIGLRILLGFCARLAEEYGKSIRPILAFAAEHFVRVHLLIERSAAPLPIGQVVRAGAGSFRTVTAVGPKTIGPLWLGALGDADVMSNLAPSKWTSVASARLLSLLQGESDLPPFFATTDELAAFEKGSPPKIERFIGGLREIGYRATRTHFHPRGVKTDAPPDDVLRVFRTEAPIGSTGG